MNDLEAAHIVEPAPTSPPSPEEAIAAPITVYSRRETDEGYEGVIVRDGDLRIVNCLDDIQWIAQRFTGGQWRNKSFHRSRLSLVRRYGLLEIILALPEHHDGFVEVTPAANSVDVFGASLQEGSSVTCFVRPPSLDGKSTAPTDAVRGPETRGRGERPMPRGVYKFH
jgi:hypothetical protein